MQTTATTDHFHRHHATPIGHCDGDNQSFFLLDPCRPSTNVHWNSYQCYRRSQTASNKTATSLLEQRQRNLLMPQEDCQPPTMTPTAPNHPTNYNTYLPLTGNESTSLDWSYKQTMDKTDTGQPPTAAPKQSVKTTSSTPVGSTFYTGFINFFNR
jgi:hypothetical protein